MTGAALSLVLLTGCEDFTDMQPKGMNLLTTTDQLEMLLNKEITFGTTDMRVMANDMVNATSNIATTLNQPSKTRNAIIWTYDEAEMGKMAELTSSDYDYDEFYGIIGTVCNPVLQKIDDATGDDSKKRQLKCEALVMRAWCHYMLVNKFAAAYNPSTASSTRGIIVMTEDVDITIPQEQKTVQEVYDQILADIETCISIDALPGVALNKMRMSKPCPYALKALVCASMQQWDEAETAAKQALGIDNSMCDLNHGEYIVKTYGYMTGGEYDVINRPHSAYPEDYFCTDNLEFFHAISADTQAAVEPGHAHLNKINNMAMMYDYMMDYGAVMIGETGYLMTFDLDSGWNDAGLRVPQMYLIIAEAEIHKGNINAAMDALDVIRVNHIDETLYQPLQGSVTTEDEAIAHLKQTALGENIYTYFDFIDKKRWNEVNGWEQSITRHINGQTYTLKPGSKLWIFPIPQNAINNNPNLEQNYK